MIASKRLAGVFAGAPSVALASLLITIIRRGTVPLSILASGMILWAIAFVAYVLTVLVLTTRLHPRLNPLPGAFLGWPAVRGCRGRDVDGGPVSLLDPGKLRKVSVWEYAERFLLGACISGTAAIVGQLLGDKVGGASGLSGSVPASLTLASNKEGPAAAVEHERGAAFGGLGKLAFAITVTLTAGPLGAWAIAAGVAAWAAAGLGSFLILHGGRAMTAVPVKSGQAGVNHRPEGTSHPS
jgi:hypothetical protein